MRTEPINTSEGAAPIDTVERRTKRRYAHELYPHAGEWETRPLSLDVPYWYAQMVGYELTGTGWHSVEPAARAGDRVQEFLYTARIALLADALAQGMTRDEAWAWASERVTDDMEGAWERAVEHGVATDLIKPYPCGPEPQDHYHYSAPDARGSRLVTVVKTAESECDECTEPVGATS